MFQAKMPFVLQHVREELVELAVDLVGLIPRDPVRGPGYPLRRRAFPLLHLFRPPVCMERLLWHGKDANQIQRVSATGGVTHLNTILRDVHTSSRLGLVSSRHPRDLLHTATLSLPLPYRPPQLRYCCTTLP